MRNRALGLDLGQVQDPTALALVEWTENDDGERVYALRHLERLPLGTGYPAVADHLEDVMAALGQTASLVVDATGVGRAPVDYLRRAGLRVVPVVVHAGREESVDEHGYHRVPKRELVGIAQTLLQDRRLKFAPRLPFVKDLEEELLKFEVKITDSGTDVYGAWREGAHDDLVFALCLATWYGESRAGTPLPVHGGTISRLTDTKPTEDQRARRAILGRGVDPKASGLVVGRNGTGRY